jgi:hypothetical protein
MLLTAKHFNSFFRGTRLTVALLAITFAATGAQAHKISEVASTVPSNGDINPYGLAVVPTTTGSLVRGNFLVSNFNNSANLQGTGTTIVQISSSGGVSLFAQIDPSNLPGPCPGGIGLSTALVALKSGWVIVGSLPTTDGTSATARSGCLLVLDSSGHVAETFYGSLINGPWDMTAADDGNNVSLFVTNVLNGTVAAGGKVVDQGTVLRVDLALVKGALPRLESMTIIGSGFPERTDPAALVIGPTGVALGSNDGDGGSQVLYIADSLNNRIAAISNPLQRTSSDGIGKTIATNGSLNDPLGLTVVNRNVLTVNGNDGYAVETDSDGHQIVKVLLDSSGNPPGAGALFGLVVVGQKLYYVDDAENDLKLFQ